MAKVKVPRKVAGVKIPKKVRKTAKKALKLAGNPIARDAAVAALGAAGIGKAVQEAADGDGRRPGKRRVDAETLLEVVREAALDGVRRFLEGFEDGLRKATEKVGDAAEAVDESDGREGRGNGGRKPRSRRAEDAAAP